MEVTTARIAFVGAGEHATESLYPNIPLIPEFDFAAICDIDLSKAEYCAKRFGVGRYFDSVEKMLDDVKPQGVCLCGPPAMHHQVGLSVLKRGIPIFVEKPLGDHLDQAIELAETASTNGTWGQVGFMKRFAPANVLAKEFMLSGDFGTLSSLSLMHGCGPYPNYRKMLHFNGIHMIDAARYFGGDFERLFAYCADGGSDNFGIAISGKLKNGGVVQINQNSGQTWDDCFEGVYISGSKAALYIDGSKDVEIMSDAHRFAEGKGLKTFGFRSKHTVPGNVAFWWAGGHYQRGYWSELSQFAKSIIGETEPGPTLDEGVKAHAIIEAICKSIETRSDVELI